MPTVVPFEAAKRPDPEAALTALVNLVADDLQAVNQLIIERLHSPVTLIPEVAKYLVGAGGKRLRPVLTLAAAKLCGNCDHRAHQLAASVEFIHTATLLHDDVVDESDMRRGNPSANTVFGNQASVLVGDFLFSRAFQLMVEDGSLETLGILSNASATIAEGEVLQLMTSNDASTSEQAYYDVIRCKTAELFAAACQVGAVVAGAHPSKVEALRSYGHNLGIAFQIVDDVLDYSAHQAKLGKIVGDDFREGKLTLPVILAIARGDETERAFWHRTLDDHQQTDADFAQAQTYLQKHHTLSDSIARAKHYAAIARDALGILPATPLRTALQDVVDFVVNREY
ncbi:MAG: polyprenyl synthetase family protein [Bdellovibrionales bacterium]